MISFVCPVSESDDLSQKTQPSKYEKYELATHTVKIRRTGALSDVQAIWDLPGSPLFVQVHGVAFSVDL